MKKYTVNQVVKLVDRSRKFNLANEDDTLLLPAMVCFCVGGSIFTTTLTQGSALGVQAETIFVVVSSAIAALGATKTAKILFNDKISANFSKKITKIYEEMGYDFKKEVEKEYNQQHKTK